MKRKSLLAGVALALALTISTLAANTTGINNVEYHTVDEILTLYHMMELDETVTTSYVVEPDFSGYTTSGVLSAETQENALDTLNFVRYIAGLSYDVTISDTYAQYAQDGAFALGGMGTGLVHTFAQTSWMNDEFYASAYKGTSKGNISAGRSNLAVNIIQGWMADESASNIATLGHRRWILNPTMEQTGFGLVYNSSSSYKYYSAMYAMDGAGGSTDVSGVIWPAQNMPVEYFGDSYPWSYSLGSMVGYDVSITLTRLNDGEQWVIENSFIDGATGDGYISINDDTYGLKGCISFIPDNISYSAGDVYQVEITGTYVNASYTVNFFSLSDSYTVQSSVSYNGEIETEVTPEPEVEVEVEVEVEPEADLSGAHSWAQAELQEAWDAGYPVDLYADQFQESMTRGEFAHMLGSFMAVRWSMAESYATAYSDLGDDPADAERNYYINALSNWGIIDGYTDGTFHPDDTITREAAAKLLAAAAEVSRVVNITQDISSYNDADSVSNWALDGVRYMNQLGVLNGTTDNYLDPKGEVTVEQTALMCYRLKP